MLKLLVHVHIYYHEQVDYIIEKLNNIVDCAWDLYVTYSQYNEDTEQKIKQFKSDTHFINVKNVGYDVWPFIVVLKEIDLKQYDLVLKLHTKGYYKEAVFFNNCTMKGFGWRDTLYDTYLYSKDVFKNILKKFEDKSEIGIIVNKNLFLQFGIYCKRDIPEETFLMNKIKERLDIHSDYSCFVAGTIFMARADIFDKLKNSDISENNFSTVSRGKISGSFAHVLERVFCILADDKGYKVLAIKNKNRHPYKSILKQIFSIIETTNCHKAVIILGIRIKIKNKFLNFKDILKSRIR